MKFHEIGQKLVSGALDRTKKIRKAGADIFANCEAEQLGQTPGKQKKKTPQFPLISLRI